MRMRFFYILVFTATILMYFLFQRQIQSKKIHQVSSPNILFIVLDGAQADHFSCYGYIKNTTPCIDTISRKGTLFLNNFSPGTTTSISIPRIFFSRYFSTFIFQNDECYLENWAVRYENSRTIFKKFDDQQIFLTEILSRHGYRTALFHNNALFNKDSYLVQKFDESFSFDQPGLGTYPVDWKIISAVISWIKKNKEKPFFIYYHIMSPHQPYPFKEEDDEFLIGEDRSAIQAVREKTERLDHSTNGWTQRELGCLRMLYNSNLKHSDKWIGVLYDKLRELSLEDKTLIIITSDHGENLGEHNQSYHGGMPWDSVTKVPLIMVYPPLIPAGVKVSGLTESIDIMPTILDICRIELPHGKSMDGVSLLKFIQNPEMGKEAVFTSPPEETIRTAEYKYLISHTILYDLKKDPGEKENIVEQKPLIAMSLQEKYEKAMWQYRKRYEEARREGPVNFPFFFAIRDFKLAPEDIFEKCNDWRDNITVLKEVSPTKAWLLNEDDRRFGLFCLPANGLPPPFTLSAPLPNGTYRISVVLESPEEISFASEQLGFQFRFDSQKSFAFPDQIEFVRRTVKGPFLTSLDLGETVVKKENFSVELEFHPPDERLYIIRLINFTPSGYQKRRLPVPEESDEEYRRRIENLRSLGYL